MSDEKVDRKSEFCYFGCSRCVDCIRLKVRRESNKIDSYCSLRRYEKKSILKVLFGSYFNSKRR